MSGKVYLVGSGPGGEGLLTKRARVVIDAADVILYDQLPGEEILASLPARAEKIDCGKYGGKHTLEQDEIEALMVDRAQQGNERGQAQRRGSFPVRAGRRGTRNRPPCRNTRRNGAGSEQCSCRPGIGRNSPHAPEIRITGDDPDRQRRPDQTRACA